MVVVAQLVRAPDCGSGGRRFETDLPPKIKAFQFSERLLLFGDVRLLFCFVDNNPIWSIGYFPSGIEY